MPDAPDDFPVLLEATLTSMLDAMDEGALIFDLEGTARIIGRRLGELFGREPAQLLGKPRMELLKMLSLSAEEPESFLATVAVNDLDLGPTVHGEVELRSPRPRIVIWSSYPLVHEGKRKGRLCLARDVTRERSAERARAALQRRLENALPNDPLTGLTNRRRFLEELEREHQRAARAWDPYSVLLVDVDDLGAINGEHGQPVGDRVLEEVASAIKRTLREYDVASRLDADDFALLLPGADVVAAQAVSERLVLAVRDLRVLPDLLVSISIGAAVWQPATKEGPSEVLVRAGAALERAQVKGPSSVAVESDARSVPPSVPPGASIRPPGSHPPSSRPPKSG